MAHGVTFTSEARVRTLNARKYAVQVGKHWAHNLQVEEHGEAIAIAFPKDARGADWPGEAVVTLTPELDALLCRIDASAEGQRDALKGAVARHVDRFAFREEPLRYDWQDR
jgi:uncharacterized protein